MNPVLYSFVDKFEKQVLQDFTPEQWNVVSPVIQELRTIIANGNFLSVPAYGQLISNKISQNVDKKTADQLTPIVKNIFSSYRAVTEFPQELMGVIFSYAPHLANNIQSLLNKSDHNSIEFAKTILALQRMMKVENVVIGPGFNDIQDLIDFAAENLGYIRRLDLSVFKDTINDENLEILMTLCPDLEYLSLADCIQITSLQCLQDQTEIKELNLSGCISLRDQEFNHLANLSALEVLNLSNCGKKIEKEVDRKGEGIFRVVHENCFSLEALKNVSPNLKTLILRNYRFNDQSFNSLSHFNNLKSLDISECIEIQSDTWKFLKNLKLEILIANDIVHDTLAIGDFIFSEIAQIETLKELHLENNEISWIYDFGKLTQLRILSLKNSKKLQFADFSALTQLEVLDLSACPKFFTQLFVAEVDIGDNVLRETYIGDKNAKTAPYNNVNNAKVITIKEQKDVDLSQLSRLRALKIEACYISDEFMSSLISCQNLQELSLGRITLNVHKGQCLSSLNKLQILRMDTFAIASEDVNLNLPNLRILELTNAVVRSQSFFQSFRDLTHLQHLKIELSSPHTTQKTIDLSFLESLANLETLRVNWNSYAIDLDAFDVICLVKLEKLIHLEICSYNRITNIQYLLFLPHLGVLNIDCKALTDADFRSISYKPNQTHASLHELKVSTDQPLSEKALYSLAYLPRLTKLELQASKIHPNAFQYLIFCKKLEEISFRSCGIMINDLIKMKACRNLTKVFVTCCDNITEEDSRHQELKELHIQYSR